MYGGKFKFSNCEWQRRAKFMFYLIALSIVTIINCVGDE